MNEKEYLTRMLKKQDLCSDDLKVGRTIPFGKYKGSYVFLLLIQHPFYMDWVLNNTNFKLNDAEKWWREETRSEVETSIALMKADSIINSLPIVSASMITPNVENPHTIIE